MNRQDEQRYLRNIMLPEIGLEGQEKLSRAKALVVGAGGLGSPAALYLAAAGVGEIGLMDGDVVELSNLQRQILHATKDLGKPKVESAAEKLRALNPSVNLRLYDMFMTPENADEIIRGYDFVLSCTDNFEVKFLLNDACLRLGKAFSHGGIRGFEGQAFTHLPGTACYRCIFGSAPPEGSTKSGVLGAAAGILGSIQAAETIKYICRIPGLLTNRLLTFDIRTMEFRTFAVDGRCNHRS